MFMPVVTEFHFCYICSLVTPLKNRRLYLAVCAMKRDRQRRKFFGIEVRKLYEVVGKWKQMRGTEKSQLTYFLGLKFACYINFSFPYS